MKLDALDHPKTFDFAARLGVELPTAIGHLELLWAFAGKQAPAGNIGKWPDGAIARACYWMGRPEVFTLALREAGFIDPDDTHRLTIHDWREHAPRWVKSKLQSLGLVFVGDILPDIPEDVSRDTSADTSPPSKGSVLKGSEGKGRVKMRAPARETPDAKIQAAAELPPGLDPAAWSRWHDYRVKIRKPLKPVSIPAAQRELAAFGCNQSAVVEQSVAQGWQGLFELKRRINGAKTAIRLRTADEIEAEEVSRGSHAA